MHKHAFIYSLDDVLPLTESLKTRPTVIDYTSFTLATNHNMKTDEIYTKLFASVKLIIGRLL